MKASTRYNSRHRQEIKTMRVSQQVEDGHTLITLLAPEAPGHKKAFRRFEIVLTETECQKLYNVLGGIVGHKHSMAEVVGHGLAVGFGQKLGECLLGQTPGGSNSKALPTAPSKDEGKSP